MFDDWQQFDAASTRPALITDTQSLTWSDFLDQIQRQTETLSRFHDRRVGVLLAPNFESITCLLALLKSRVHTYLMAAGTAEDSVRQWTTDFGLSAVFQSDGSETQGKGATQDAVTGAITILTSGTTGKPKAVEHTWESLVRPVRQLDDDSHPRWLLTYRPHLYAGLQVILQCLLNRGALVMPGAGQSAEQVALMATNAGAEFASATPSYWRWLLTLAGSRRLSSIPLRQITLGGEAVDQATLSALRATFPNTRLVHIYATTELGRCFSVTDGQAGFPSRFLEKPSPDGVEMRIDDGELVVRSANSMSRYDRAQDASPRSAWFSTGDLVSLEGDRVFFVGRKTDMINVGGNKVYPLEVEKVIRAVPGVADVRVFGESSSLVGELVKCEIVVASDCLVDEVEQAVRMSTRQELQPFQCPRFISVVSEIPRTTAGKTARR